MLSSRQQWQVISSRRFLTHDTMTLSWNNTCHLKIHLSINKSLEKKTTLRERAPRVSTLETLQRYEELWAPATQAPPASNGHDPDSLGALPSFRVTPVTFTNKQQAVTVTKEACRQGTSPDKPLQCGTCAEAAPYWLTHAMYCCNCKKCMRTTSAWHWVQAITVSTPALFSALMSGLRRAWSTVRLRESLFTSLCTSSAAHWSPIK